MGFFAPVFWRAHVHVRAEAPGTAMAGMLADPQQRADVIAYLFTLKE